MKEGVKNCARSIGFVVSLLIPYKLYTGYKKIASLIFSGYVKRQFDEVGSGLSITAPMQLQGGKLMKIGNNFVALSGLWISAYENYEGNFYTPELIIKNNVSFNTNCHIGCINKIVIGNNVLAASKVYITDHFHGDISLSALPPTKRPLVSKGPVIIEDNVWIGESVVILPNVTIGKNSIIGANSVVTKSFPENSVIAGVPARLIKTI